MCLPPPAGLHSWTGSSPRALEPALAMVLRAGCSWHSVNLLLFFKKNLFNFWSCWVCCCAGVLELLQSGAPLAAVCRLLTALASRCRAQALGCQVSIVAACTP